MDIRIGDIVRFISEKIEGKVTGIIDHSTVNVYCNEYGFEIPASIHDLVIIRSDLSATTDSNNQSVSASGSVDIEISDTVYLAIVPDNFNNLMASDYEFFIVNDTAQVCLYSITFRNGETYSGISAGNCNPEQTASIGSYSIKDIDNNINAIKIQAIFFRKGKTKPKNAIDAEIKINLVNLYKSGSYKHSRWFNSISQLRPLEKEHFLKEDIDEKQLQHAIHEKKDIKPSVSQHNEKKIAGNVIEIDLHINQLLETTAGMENKDILEYQLDVFRKTLEEYKLKKGQKIIFIHGKGDGVLRQRILWELQTKYKRFHHQDASFKQYSYGATQVTIK